MANKQKVVTLNIKSKVNEIYRRYFNYIPVSALKLPTISKEIEGILLSNAENKDELYKLLVNKYRLNSLVYSS